MKVLTSLETLIAQDMQELDLLTPTTNKVVVYMETFQGNKLFPRFKGIAYNTKWQYFSCFLGATAHGCCIHFLWYGLELGAIDELMCNRT